MDMAAAKDLWQSFSVYEYRQFAQLDRFAINYIKYIRRKNGKKQNRFFLPELRQ